MGDASLKDVAAIIVNHNGVELLPGCLDSLQAGASDLTLQCWLVDNASTDGSVGLVSARYPWVKVIRNQRNEGFASANNQALALCGGRYVLLLNSDALVLRDAIARLVRFMDAHREVGCVGPLLLNADGTPQASCIRFPTLLNSLSGYIASKFGGQSKYLPQVEGASHVRVDAVSGACMLLRRKTLADVGFLDDGYFMYAEETDWCFRAKRHGWSVAWYPDGQVVHYGGKTAQASPARFYVERRWSRVRFLAIHRGHLQAGLAACGGIANILMHFAFSRRRRSYYRKVLMLYVKRLRQLSASLPQRARRWEALWLE